MGLVLFAKVTLEENLETPSSGDIFCISDCATCPVICSPPPLSPSLPHSPQSPFYFTFSSPPPPPPPKSQSPPTPSSHSAPPPPPPSKFYRYNTPSSPFSSSSSQPQPTVAVMAGLAPEGSQFDARRYDANMNELSTSYANGQNMQIESYHGAPRPDDYNSYSTSHVQTQMGKDLKKGKSISRFLTKSWSIADPEITRKKRVAGYKMYYVEGKVKDCFRKSFRWLKNKCTSG
ncbi:unnamed protein product [Lupinus luteus]|uniref:Uncharacterized protein n=1 Tax=Lupinus luteus TaxID=3873 RepID=A0AAV1Y0Q0_LUPLU